MENFKCGDYIVILRDGSKSGGFRRNNVYRVYTYSPVLVVEKDSFGKKCNKWNVLQYDNKDDWRLANDTEIANYVQNNGPVRANKIMEDFMSMLYELENKFKI